MSINWEKSYFLTAEQVSLLGLDGISVNDHENITVEQQIVNEIIEVAAKDKATRIRDD